MNKSKINNSRTRNLSRFSTILSVFLILVLIITSISGIASAKDANEHADSAFPTEKLSWNWLGLNNLNLTLNSSNYTYGHFDNVEIVYTSQDDIYDDVNLLSSGTGTQPQILKIPDRFDLRTEGRTPPLKDQGIFSTC